MVAKISRREFIKKTAAVGAGVYGLTGPLPELLAQAKESTGKSRVVIVRDNSVQDAEGNFKAEVLRKMLSEAMKRLAGTKSEKAAWQKYVKPTDFVGIKVNCLFGKGASTHPQVTAAIVEGLKMAGVKEENIVIWDRSDGDLAKAGYRLNREGPGVKCYGTEGDYEPEVSQQGAFRGRLSKILTQKITALINVPILKDHNQAGVTIAMKNHLGSINNPGDQHPNNCNPYLADLNCVPAIKNKTRLIICEAIRPTANGGPGYNPRFIWDYNGLIFGTDPVALDYTGWQIIEARRKEIGLPSLAEALREPKWIASAAERGLGTNDPKKIELIEI